jgi:AraC-like DNA-binding protein
MSYSALRQLNRGAYSDPFSGVGIEFYPLGLPPGPSGVLLHETGYLRHNDWWTFSNVLSPFWRLYYNFRPGHKVIFAKAEYELTPERLVLIPDHQLFHCHGPEPAPNFWITFQVSRRLALHQPVPIILPVRPVERLLLRQVTRHFTGIGKGDTERIFHLSQALLHVALVRSEIHWLASTVSDSLQRAIRDMETKYAAPLKMETLARTAGLSVRGFSKAFQKSRGIAPGKFLSQVRVREAADLLANSNSSMEEIAEKTGFPNRHYLSRKFKQVTGDSPARFRRKLRRTSPSKRSRPANSHARSIRILRRGA